MEAEPNPARDRVTLCSPFDVILQWNLRIITLDGRVVYEQVCSTSCVDIPLATFPVGTYVFTATHAADVRTRSFTVAK